MKLSIIRLGKMEYSKVLAIQEQLLTLRQQDKVSDILLLVEHPPVLTIGRNGKESNIMVPEAYLASKGVSIFEVSRGGDVTYHGPGQVVGYPIVSLDITNRDIKVFMRNIEEVFIRLLKENFEIDAHSEDKKYTGVWVNDEKITAIGIAVKRWITMHGFAFNVNTELEHFKWIIPCGLADKGVTSLKKLTGVEQDFNKLNSLTARYFCEVFGYVPEWKDMNWLLERGISI